MARPVPPSVEEIEEDLASAPHTDPVFCISHVTAGGLSGESSRGGGEEGEGDDVDTVSRQAVEIVLHYDKLREDGAHSVRSILATVEKQITELRTKIPSNVAAAAATINEDSAHFN